MTKSKYHPVAMHPDTGMAYVYILFYSMIKEADMRLSSDVSMR